MVSRYGFLFALGGALLFAACGGGGGGSSSDASAASPLVLIDASVSGTDGVPINEIIRFEFSVDLDPDTVRPDTIRIRQGPDYGKQVAGTYRVDGNRVEFFPRLPVLADLSDSGFQPGTPYRITLPGTPEVATVRSFANDHITQTVTLDFQTADASAAGLFRDNFLDPLPPTILFVNPPDGATDVPADGDITLTFNRRPLNPGTVTDTNIRLFMQERGGEILNRVIPINLVLTQNHESVQVRVVPKFPLADVATYRLEVNRRLQDLVGNDVQPPGGQSLYESTFTVRDEPFRTTSISLTFNEADRVEFMDENETIASWNEVVPDAVAAIFTAAGGNGRAGDLKPTASQTFQPEDFTRGIEVMTIDNVETDVYNFRTIEIPAGVQVRFTQRKGGPNRPILLLSLKNVQISGTLNVSGGNGVKGETVYTSSAIPAGPGGKAGPGGGDGADRDDGPVISPFPYKNGDDVFYGGGGGKGGGGGSYNYSYYYAYSSYTYYYRYAYGYASGGGGGGGNRTRGQDGEAGTYPSSGYFGLGGDGGKTSFERGFGYNFERRPNVGGGGGAAGGKGFYDYYYYYNSGGYSYTSRSQYLGGAGSGGGGGGGIAVQSAGDVKIAGTGAILADGGIGGDTMYYYAYGGGGGGGGAGGSVKVAATGQVFLDPGATISVTGGAGGIFTGTYTYYTPGLGGAGGQGYIRFEALEDENAPGKAFVNGVATSNLTYAPPSVGTFAPQGGGAPSVVQTLWMNLGVIDPVMAKLAPTDIIATTYNDTMSIFVQMAIEDPQNLGNPDLSDLDFLDQDKDGETNDTKNPATLSEWVPLSSIPTLNGRHYQFLRIRVIFQLDPGQVASDPLPYLDLLSFPYGF